MELELETHESTRDHAEGQRQTTSEVVMMLF